MEVEIRVVSLSNFLVPGIVGQFSMLPNYVMNGKLLDGMRSLASLIRVSPVRNSCRGVLLDLWT